MVSGGGGMLWLVGGHAVVSGGGDAVVNGELAGGTGHWLHIASGESTH